MSSAVDLKTKEERDAELDRRVEAMRKKNEALVKRYQEIEEDKKKAEQEGIAITTPRKPRAHEHDTDRRKTDKENFTVTVDLSKVAGEKRVVNDWKTGPPRGRKTSEEGDSHGGPIDGPRGQNDSPRGHSDSPRGQNDSPRGHSDSPRGHSDSPRGQNDSPRGHSDSPRGQNDGPRGHSDSPRGQNDGPRGHHSDSPRGHSDSPRGQNDGPRGHSDSPRGQNDGPRGHSDSPRGQSDGPWGHSDGHSPPRRPGSGRVGRGGQRGGGERRQERREWQPRTPRDRDREGEPGESGGPRRGGRRGRGGEGRGGEGRGRGEEGDGGTPGGIDKKSKEWEEKRRQNIEKMNEEMEKIAEYERGQRADGDKPIRNFLDDPRRSGPVPDIDRKDGSRRHVRNWGGLDFEKVKTGAELEREWTSRRPGPKGSMDMTMSMTGRERAEYLRWKKERDDIDEERLARHRNATGQWRREWDSQKTDGMFKEDPNAVADGVAPEQGGRRARGRTSRTEPRGRASDDNKRPPKVPTFGDFMSQGRSQGPRGERGERMERGDRGDRGDRGRGRGRGQKPSYSMHDNRWEAEKEEEDREKEDRTKREEKPKKKEKEGEKRPPAQKAEEKNGEGEDDEEEWEDASDGDDEGVEDGSDSEPDEKKDRGREKAARSKDSSRMSPSAPPTTTASSGSPKEQRTPRPKVHIPPPPTAAQESPEGGKPLSPFALLDSHQPVTDWGEEMEMQSPRTSLGGESPLKPLSLEASPSQKKEEVEEEKSKTAEPHRDQETDVSPPPVETRAEPTVIVSEPVPEPVGPAPSEVREVAVTTDQDTPAAPSQADRPDSPPSPAVLEAETSASQPAGDKDDDTAPTGTDTAPIETAEEEEEKSSEQTSSG